MSCGLNSSNGMVKTMSTRIPDSLTVHDVMLPLSRFPVVGQRTLLKEALEAMGQFRLGIACIVGSEEELLGILTDGDVRRKLLRVQKPFSALFVDDALDHAIRQPVTTTPGELLQDAVRVMGERQIWDLPVVDGQGTLKGLLHLHPAVEALLERAHERTQDKP
jgi:CBS domain-containing protein